MALRPSPAGDAATASTSPCSMATTSPTTPARASSTPRPATAARTSRSGWRARRLLQERGIDTRIPYTVDENGAYTDEAPGFEGKRVLTEKGEKGDANEAVIEALIEAGNLLARGKLKHQYPHSWRSKKPVIFRNTPQWFIAMDSQPMRRRRASSRDALESDRRDALGAADRREPHPRHGQRQARLGDEPPARLGRAASPCSSARASTTPCSTTSVNARIAEAFEQEGADAWYAEGAAARFLGPDYDPADLREGRRRPRRLVRFRLDPRLRAGGRRAFPGPRRHQAQGRRRRGRGDVSGRLRPASRLVPGLAAGELRHARPRAVRRRADAWLHARREGPQEVEIARQPDASAGRHQGPAPTSCGCGWRASTITDDQRIGPDILKMVSDNYRKLRNTLRWMLGMLAHYDRRRTLGFSMIEPLDRLMLHRLGELDVEVRKAYADFDFARVVSALSAFLNTDLSAFYFDMRKDALYCEPISSLKRLGAWRRSSASSAP